MSFLKSKSIKYWIDKVELQVKWFPIKRVLDVVRFIHHWCGEWSAPGEKHQPGASSYPDPPTHTSMMDDQSLFHFHFFTHPQPPGWHQGNRPYWGPTCTGFQRPKAKKTLVSINCNIISKPTNTRINPFHKPAKRIYVCLRGRRRSWRCFGGRQRPEEEEVNSKSLEDAIALGHGERSRNWTKFLWKEKAWEISKLIASTCFNVFTCQNSPRGRLVSDEFQLRAPTQDRQRWR